MELDKGKILAQLDMLKLSTNEIASDAMVLARQANHPVWRQKMQGLLDRHVEQLDKLALALKLLPPVAEGAIEGTEGETNGESSTEEKTQGTQGTAPASDAPTSNTESGLEPAGTTTDNNPTGVSGAVPAGATAGTTGISRLTSKLRGR